MAENNSTSSNANKPIITPTKSTGSDSMPGSQNKIYEPTQKSISMEEFKSMPDNINNTNKNKK